MSAFLRLSLLILFMLAIHCWVITLGCNLLLLVLLLSRHLLLELLVLYLVHIKDFLAFQRDIGLLQNKWTISRWHSHMIILILWLASHLSHLLLLRLFIQAWVRVYHLWRSRHNLRLIYLITGRHGSFVLLIDCILLVKIHVNIIVDMGLQNLSLRVISLQKLVWTICQ